MGDGADDESRRAKLIARGFNDEELDDMLLELPTFSSDEDDCGTASGDVNGDGDDAPGPVDDDDDGDEGPSGALAAARAAQKGVRVKLCIRSTPAEAEADLATELQLPAGSTTSCEVGGLVECDLTGDGQRLTLRALLERVLATLSPALAHTADGASILATLRSVCAGHTDAADLGPASDVIVELVDRDGQLRLPANSSTDAVGRDGSARVAAALPTVVPIASYRERLPYRAKLVLMDGDRTIRLAEQPGRGIGCLTFGGALGLGIHFAKSFPPGHWAGKRVLELGGGAGLLAVVLASLGAHVTVTDRAECMRVAHMNATINAKLLEETGGSVTPAVLEWGERGLAAFPVDPAGYDCIVGAEVVYPHELDSKDSHRNLMATLCGLIRPDCPGIVLHCDRSSGTERKFFQETAPANFDVSSVPGPDWRQHATVLQAPELVKSCATDVPGDAAEIAANQEQAAALTMALDSFESSLESFPVGGKDRAALTDKLAATGLAATVYTFARKKAQ